MKLTLSLIVLNIAVFALSVLSTQSFEYLLNNFGFSVNSFLSGNYYTIITSMFLHAGLLHLAGNMFALFVLGWAVEKKVKAWQYLLVYFFSGIIGSLSLFIPIFGYSSDTIAVGASAAISGLVGLGIFICPGKLVMFPAILPLPFSLAGAIYLLATLSGLLSPGYVAYSAHLFGFLAGVLFGLMWGEKRIARLVIFVALLLLIVALPTILHILLNILL